MFIYRIYISSQIIVTSPDVTPVSLPGFVLLLALYPASCTHTHIHTHLMRMSWKSTAYWYEIIYTVHLDSNIPIYCAKESDWSSCIDIAWGYITIKGCDQRVCFWNVSQHVQTSKAVSFTRQTQHVWLKDSYYAASSTSPKVPKNFTCCGSFSPSVPGDWFFGHPISSGEGDGEGQLVIFDSRLSDLLHGGWLNAISKYCVETVLNIFSNGAWIVERSPHLSVDANGVFVVSFPTIFWRLSSWSRLIAWKLAALPPGRSWNQGHPALGVAKPPVWGDWR